MGRRSSERKFPIEFRAGRRVQTIRCGCGEVAENPIGDHPAGGDDLVAGHFRGVGWDVDARHRPDRHTCPKCLAAERERKRNEKRPPMNTPTPAPQASPASPAAIAAALAAPPGKAKSALPKPEPRPDLVTFKLDATMLLGDHYDVHAKDYRATWSDERVAKESGMPLEWVRRRREDDFGPLPPPTPKLAVAALAKVEPLAKLAAEHAENLDRLKGVLGNLVSAAARQSEALASLRAQLAEAAAKEMI